MLRSILNEVSKLLKVTFPDIWVDETWFDLQSGVILTHEFAALLKVRNTYVNTSHFGC